MIEDAAQALRALLRRPHAPLLAALGLSVGLGVAAAVASLLDATLLRPLPGASPERLVAIHGYHKQDGSFTDISYLDFRELEDAGGYAGALAYFRAPLIVAVGERSRRLPCEMVSSRYFDVIGLPLGAGRGFLAKEGEPPDTSAVAVIGDGLARREFGEPGAAVGKAIRVSGRTYQVVGVAARGFQGLSIDRLAPPELWVPLGGTGELSPAWAGTLERRGSRLFRVVARLPAGRTRADAERDAASIAAGLERRYPDTNQHMTLQVASGPEARVSPQLRRRIVALGGVAAGVVAFLALVVSSNVGHLLLLHACGRSRELAIREAVGAEPRRIVRQLALESAIVAAAGFLGSLAVASALLRGMKAYAPPFGLPAGADLLLDRRIVLLALLLSVATNLAFGATAALAASRINWRRALYGGRSPLPALAPRLGRMLLSGQVALALVLLIGGAVFERTVLESLERPPGFTASGIHLLSVSLNGLPGRYDEASGLRYFASAMEEIRRLPAVQSAAWSAAPPFEVRRLLAWWREDPAQPWIQTDVDIVSPDYFRMMGTRIKRGREFLASDDATAPGVAIVNEASARKHWPGADAIGRRLLVRGRAREVYEVVGVAEDVKRRTLWDEPEPFLYLPLAQRYFPELTLHVKGDARGAAEILRGIDPDLPAFDPRRMEGVVALAVADQRFGALLLGTSGLIGALIAVLGLYASTAYVVTQRTHELAIRSVLGATRRQSIRQILGDCGAPVALGLVAGLGLAAGLSRFMAGLVHGVSPLDPASFALSCAALAATCLAAIYLPASRAIRADPAEVLRAE